jgi:hypothetical protein
VRNTSGDTVPLGFFTRVSDTTGPYRVPRHNLYPAAEIDRQPAPDSSQGQAIDTMQKIARETLPPGFNFANGPRSRSSRSGPSTPLSLPSCSVWCSYFWRSPRRMRASRCRSPYSNRADVSRRLHQWSPVARAGQ